MVNNAKDPGEVNVVGFGCLVEMLPGFGWFVRKEISDFKTNFDLLRDFGGRGHTIVQKEFDAVILGGVMGGGDDDAARTAEMTNHNADAGRGDYPEVNDS